MFADLKAVDFKYLFDLGKIRTIQLEYTDAKESLFQAARKAPVAARGFRIQCNSGYISPITVGGDT